MGECLNKQKCALSLLTQFKLHYTYNSQQGRGGFQIPHSSLSFITISSQKSGVSMPCIKWAIQPAWDGFVLDRNQRKVLLCLLGTLTPWWHWDTCAKCMLSDRYWTSLMSSGASKTHGLHCTSSWRSDSPSPPCRAGPAISQKYDLCEQAFFSTLGKQCSQSSWTAPSISNKEPGKYIKNSFTEKTAPGNSGNLMKLGAPAFFLNSNTLTAPKNVHFKTLLSF